MRPRWTPVDCSTAMLANVGAQPRGRGGCDLVRGCAPGELDAPAVHAGGLVRGDARKRRGEPAPVAGAAGGEVFDEPGRHHVGAERDPSVGGAWNGVLA